MYCRNCGAEIKEGQKFCGKCGVPVDEFTQETVNVQEGYSSDEEPSVAEPKTDTLAEKPKKKRGWLIPVIIAVALVAAAVICVCVFLFTSRSSPLRATVDIPAYMTVTCTGYDGYGSASVSIDFDQIVKDYGEKIRIRTEETDSLESILSSSIGASLDKDTDLSDKDVLTITFSVDETYLDETLNCNFTYEDQSYTVEGLKTVNDVDVFEGVEPVYSATAPFAHAELGSGAQGFQYGSYEVSPEDNLSNGDEVTVTFTVSDTMSFLNEYEGLPSVTEKTFTVSGLDSYIMDITELSDENFSALKKDAKDQAEACGASMSARQVADMLDSGLSVPKGGCGSDYKLENLYFMTIKSSTDKDREADNVEVSVPVFVYSVSASVTALYDLSAKGRIYISVDYPHLLLKSDGTMTGLDDVGTYIHESLDDAYNEWASRNKDNYNITTYDADLKEVN